MRTIKARDLHCLPAVNIIATNFRCRTWYLSSAGPRHTFIKHLQL